ncbi:MAG TPA: hypothetical protein VKD69_20135 [Vicinamibacterales bacterium]|nr:hypothetical protein [Vicinamibacterales bacterium]
MLTLALLVITLVPSPLAAADKPSISGAWTMNKELSDASPRGDSTEGRGRGRDGQRGGYRGRGGFRGGYGGGRMGGGGAGGERMDPEEQARMREAIRDLTDPSDRLTITETDSMILVTGADGRTTRLSPDGKKVKDENTGVERKTKWDGAKLVSEISGLRAGKATQTFVVVPETHQLRVTVQMEGRGGRGGNQPRTITHVYDADAQK